MATLEAGLLSLNCLGITTDVQKLSVPIKIQYTHWLEDHFGLYTMERIWKNHIYLWVCSS